MRYLQLKKLSHGKWIQSCSQEEEEEEAQNSSNSSGKLAAASSKEANHASHEDNSKSNSHNSDCTPIAPSSMPCTFQIVLEKLEELENQLARARAEITLVLENQQ